MNVLIYVGPAPSRTLVIQFSKQIVQNVATSVTLVTGGGKEGQALLEDAAQQIQTPTNVPVHLQAVKGNAQVAILTAARERAYDLAIFGRLNQPIGRLLPGIRSKVIAQRLEPSVMRVQGTVRPIKRMLIASGGDYHTFDDVSVSSRIAKPLGASMTILHVISQQSLLFEGFPQRQLSVEDFLAGNSPEANTLRDAATFLQNRGVDAQVKGRVGPVIDEIKAELRSGDYDLLVIGEHQAGSALDRILLEDITTDLLDLSSLPVMIVKGEREE